MSKAEERAEEYCKSTLVGSPYVKKMAYLKGYRQAEKDNELTWEDMMIIHKCIKDAMNFHLYKMMEGIEGQKIVYEEVLKRFKAQKGE